VDNSETVRDIVMKFLHEQDMVNSSNKLENGCIPMHCGTPVMT